MATTQQDVIKKFMASLDKTNLKGTDAINEAIKTCSSFTDVQDVIAKIVQDCKNSPSADYFLKNYCGINLNNNDTGSITGLDMGGTVSKNAADVVPETGGVNTSFNYTAFSSDGLYVMLRKFNTDGYSSGEISHATTLKFQDLSAAQKYIWQGMETWWIPNSLDLIAQSYGDNFSFTNESSAKIKGLHFGFYDYNYDANERNKTDAYFIWSHNGSVTKDMDLIVNLNYYKNVDTNDPNGSAPQANYLDRIAAWGLTEAVMAANIDYFTDLPLFVKNGIGALTTGADDILSTALTEMAGDYNKLDQALDLYVSSESFPLPTHQDSHAGGYIFMRYLARQSADIVPTSTVNDPSDSVNNSNPTLTEDNYIYTNVTSNTVLSGLSGDDSVKNNATNVTIYGNAGNDTVYNDGNNVLIDLGAGYDYVISDNENVTINGGNDNDFIFNSGSNVLINGDAGNDEIQNVVTYETDGKHYTENATINGGDGNDIVWHWGNKSIIDGGAGNDSIRSGGTTDNGGDYLTIKGGAGQDTINVDGKNSYIEGGTDDDIITLTSSAANNKIQYTNGDGNDIVYGYKDSDTLAISGAEYSTTTSGSDVIVNVGNGAVTLVGVAGKTLNISGTAKTTQTSTTPVTQTSTTPTTQTSTTPTTQTSTTSTTQTSTTSIPSGLNVSGTTLTVDETFAGDLWMTANPTYQNDSVKNIDASKNYGDMILTGNGQNNSIKSGSGQTSLWGGGAGNNTLIGGNGRNQFWYTGGGKDVVTNFSAGAADNSDVVVLAGGNLKDVTRTSSSVTLNLTDRNYIQLKTNSSSSDEVILYSGNGTNIAGAKIANSSTTSLSYTSAANYYQLSQQGNLVVNDAANNNVWLDGSQGQTFANITNINASSATGQNILAGNGVANSIIGGNGSSSLWGGVGNVSDTLTGGNGADMFWYGKNDGADFINNAAENDTVNLYDVGVNDIDFSTLNITSNQISLSFTTGGTLNINNDTNLTSTFNIAEGSFKFNRSTNSWQSA